MQTILNFDLAILNLTGYLAKLAVWVTSPPHQSPFCLTLNLKVLSMKATPNYEKDLADIRDMMERSSKFLSLSGWSGILAGILALLGTFVAYILFDYRSLPWSQEIGLVGQTSTYWLPIVLLALSVLGLTLATVLYFSAQKAAKRGEKLWSPTSKRLLVHFAVPLCTGGLILLFVLSAGITGLLAPLSLLFYGLAIHAASPYTFSEMRYLGLIQIGLGLFGCYYLEYGLLLWATGFGLVHILYGLYLHYKYER